ncbi:MAG: helix-hairpin-helix domain-containing protein [Nitrospirae bacterium]|nr:helix-hairpin-helix domain-containing protein [Nitrospirota bacterium]MDA1305451.1 helix-hairpin-helix domain-containing protein [Nitrospirota bacterium]
MNRKNNEHGRVIRLRMAVALMVIAGIMLSGCVVSKNKYEDAVADMESAKTDLEKSRMMREAVEQENDKLKTENEKVAMDLELMASEIQRIKEGRESERDLLSARESDVTKKGQMITAKLGRLQQEYQKLKSQNRAMKDTVQRYQKELKAARQAKAEQVPMEPAKTSPMSAPSQENSVMASMPKTETKFAPVVTPIKGALAPVNINSASANDLVLFLGLTKNMAEKVIANRPYRLRGELVAKQVVPKATFDVIKDRITAAPK